MMIGCRPVSLRTSSIMFCVPPGPSPGSPFHRVMKGGTAQALRQRRVEHPTVAAVVDTDTGGRGPKLFRHDENRAAGVPRYLREAALPAMVRIGKSHRLGEELVFGAGKMQLYPHAAIEACFGK